TDRGRRRDPICAQVRPRTGRSSPRRNQRALRYARGSNPGNRSDAKEKTMADTTLTWLGHASFRIDTPGGKRVYVDPFLHGNPKCPDAEQEPERVDVIAVTHGHGDHVGDTVELARKHGCTVVAQVELAGWLGKQGVEN